MPPDQHDQRGGGAFFSVLGPRASVLSRRGRRRDIPLPRSSVRANGDFNATAYEGVDAEWVVEVVAEAWLDAVPIATFMELQQCEYDGYLAQFPELAALDFSSVSPSDFMRYMPPGMLMDILRRQRENAA